ncbi:MAG: hypothetical protein WCD53_07855 [Microcoleus sp.]
MSDRPTNSGEASGSHQGQLNPSSEVVPPNVTAKRRSKAEVAVEDSRARRFSEHSTDRPVSNYAKCSIDTVASAS